MSYEEPEFFKFGSDSLWLVETIKKHYKGIPKDICEFGAGAGVMSCELSHHFTKANFQCVELQEAFFPYLNKNLQSFLTNRSVAHLMPLSHFNIDGKLKFDLIFFNPPYFDPQSTRPSPFIEREMARKHIVDSWQDWCDCALRSIASDGIIFWVHRFEMKFSEHFKVRKVASTGNLAIWCASALDIK